MGWINHHYVQLGYQLADSCAGFGWSFVLTMILLFLIDHIPGCSFRCSEDDEIIGLDIAQVGEEAFSIPHFGHLMQQSKCVGDEAVRHADSLPEKSNVVGTNMNPAVNVHGSPMYLNKACDMD